MRNISNNNNADEKHINNTLNVFKCVAVFSVICIHCGLYHVGFKGIVIDSLSRFSIPFFFLISGFYSYYENSNKAMAKYEMRIKRLIKLLIFANIVYIIYFLFNPNFNLISYLISMFSVKNLFNLLIFNIFPVLQPLWFILALLYCYILF